MPPLLRAQSQQSRTEEGVSHIRLRGPYLRTAEGEETAVLCNHDDMIEDGRDKATGRDFEVVSAPGTPCQSKVAHKGAVDEPGTSRAQETQVVYERSGVAVWPSRSRRIDGRLSCVKQGSVLFLTWLPHSHATLEADEGAKHCQELTDVATAPVSQGRYAVHPVPLSDLKAIRKQTPKLGSHHLVLILKNGLTLPPFYFGSGGVRALFSVLKQHAVLTKSDESPSTYLVNDVEDPLQRSLATLDLSDALLIDPARLQQLPSSRGASNGDASTHMALVSRMKEGVQRATQFARETTSTLLAAPRQPGGEQRGSSAISPPSRESTSAESGLTENAQYSDAKVLQAVRSLLSDTCMTPAGEDGRAETGVGQFEMVDRSESDSMSSGMSQLAPPPLTQDEWFSFMDSSGRVVDDKALRARIFSGGVDPSIRREAWKYLLGMSPRGSTAAYRQMLSQKRAAEYERIKAQWTSVSDRQAARFGKWRERLSRVDKDVNRTDCTHPFFAGPNNPNVESLRRILLTYSMYNFDLGYCQGMSDLVSPILYVMRDEATAFWCFDGLMERLEANFSADCTGMHAQLAALDGLVRLLDPELHAHLQARECTKFFFCYRWLLVHFKREFSFEEALQLWEALWSCHLTPHLHIYMCVAVLQMHRATILEADMQFDDLLGFCIRLSGRLDLGRTLRCAERLVKAAGDAGVECLRAANLP